MRQEIIRLKDSYEPKPKPKLSTWTLNPFRQDIMLLKDSHERVLDKERRTYAVSLEEVQTKLN